MILLQKNKLRRWELALLFGVAFAMLFGLYLDGAQASLRDKVVRLHVIANSDSEADQALKGKVRDRILELAESYYAPGDDLATAEAKLSAHLEDLAHAGEEVVRQEGYSYPVTATIEDTWFPTKQYEDFALPAGEYRALRIVIGEGDGRNWWCVVFPPLCLGSVTEETAETAAAAGFSQDEISLVTGESGGYIIKFKCIELWEEWKRAIQGG